VALLIGVKHQMQHLIVWVFVKTVRYGHGDIKPAEDWEMETSQSEMWSLQSPLLVVSLIGVKQVLDINIVWA
jgi:hypothetical protein